jgi:hypothetical protein
MPRSVKIIYAAFILSVFAGVTIGFIGSGESVWVPLILGALMVGGMLLVARWLTAKTGLSREWEHAREHERVGEPDTGVLAREPKQRLWTSNAYIAAQMTGPLGVVLAVVGANEHNHGLIVAGIVLVAVFFLDTLLLFPVLRARGDRQRQRPPSSKGRTSRF